MEKTMPGTTGSTFEVVGEVGDVMIGVRNIGGDSYRVRVATTKSLNLPGWKTPADGEPRYSTVVEGAVELAEAVCAATKAAVRANFGL